VLEMGYESIVINACMTVFSFGLLILALLSYRKSNNKKLLFVSLVFIIFLIKGILLSLGIFFGQFSDVLSGFYVGLFDLIILILLFIATLKR